MSAVAANIVERKARIFRFGHYPAKGWGITAAEFVAANGATGTIPIGLDPVRRAHYVGETSVLDGETGEATFAVEGDELLATFRYPDWMDRAAKKHDLKVSAVFPSRADKVLGKIDLVAKPHIPDAVIFAEEHGEVLVFEDDEPEAPEQPEDEDEDEDEPVEFSDGEKADYAQQVHEMTAHHDPSLCTGRRGVGFAEPHPADHMVRLLHDHAVREGGAYCPGMYPDHHDEEIAMTDDEIEEMQAENERLRAELKAKAVAFEEEKETPREKRLREEVQGMRAELVREKAVAFADSVTRGPNARAVRAERQHVIDGYIRAASVDARLGEAVTFSDEANQKVEGSHLDAFKAAFQARPRITVRDPKGIAFDLDEEPAEKPSRDLEEFDADVKAFATRLNGGRTK